MLIGIEMIVFFCLLGIGSGRRYAICHILINYIGCFGHFIVVLLNCIQKLF